MSSTASEINICNLALGWLGEDTISSFDDNSQRANLCKINYPRVRDAILESREWTFAVRRISLAPDSAAPEFFWATKYKIPSEVIRVLGVWGASLTDVSSLTSNLVEPEQLEWEREENYILCDKTDSINVKALVRITDTTKFSESFVNCLAARIAWYLAIPITQNRNLQADMAGLYGSLLRDAASSDGMQGRSKRIRSRYLSARR